MTSKTEVWRALPGVSGVEVSTFGRVRTLDKVVCNGIGKWLMKGHVLKQSNTGRGYLQVSIKVDGKYITKRVHRLIAKAFIPNPDGLPEINHKDNNPLNNGVSNLEWVTHEYNIAYREKYGTPAKDFIKKSPLFAINLSTLEVSHFSSQHEASRTLGFSQGNINGVIIGKSNKTHGYLFVNDDGHANDAINRKLHEIGKTGLKIR